MAQLNEAQTKTVKSMGFASFLKVNLKQILEKLSKWLVKIFDLYTICFRLPDGQKFQVTPFDVYLTLVCRLGKGPHYMDEEWSIDQNTPKLTPMQKFILTKKDKVESFKTNFIIFLVNCFFGESKNRYYSKLVLKHVKDVNQIASLQPNKDDDGPSFSAKLALSQPDSEALILANTSMVDSSVGVDREEHREDVLIDQAKHELKKDEAFLYLV
ncbi:hypothetical protein Cgig2_007765 [Carnegiea gigantea]|uniref:Uncharacterized protein n=1 Tax=Carnegiea gigantea TaxID=171969 RepID=A0A9Q1GKK4_9CARY|nr:hypothetical protein Cgig2_007765 [Carnegiea gigantea]